MGRTGLCWDEVIQPAREFERGKVLDGVEDGGEGDEELPFGEEAWGLGYD
jgi:hypothetical protein